MRTITAALRLLLLPAFLVVSIHLQADIPTPTLPDELKPKEVTAQTPPPPFPSPTVASMPHTSSLSRSMTIIVCLTIVGLGLLMGLAVPKRPPAKEPPPMVPAQVPPVRELGLQPTHFSASIRPVVSRGVQIVSFPHQNETDLGKIKNLLEELMSREKASR